MWRGVRGKRGEKKNNEKAMKIIKERKSPNELSSRENGEDETHNIKETESPVPGAC